MFNLAETLAAAGKPTESLECADGSAMLVLPYGGRVLGLYAPGSEQNFFWTHPALETPETAESFFASWDWQNTGGDRTWLAPEVDLFLPEYPDTSRYHQPRQLDPGSYRAERIDGTVRLTNRFAVTLSRSRVTVEVEIVKQVRPTPNPLRHERGFSLGDVEYAGYSLNTTLETFSREGVVGLWNLVQMPHGGELLVPTYARAEPTVYFGSIPHGDLSVRDRLIRYHMRQDGEHKLGVRAVATAGRVGYLFGRGSTWQLIVRHFSVNPSGEYVDCPWGHENDLGYAVQACNVHSKLGSFSELEYHAPAIGEGTGLTRCVDVSQVWAFRGSREAVRSVARSLLSPEA